MRRLNLEGADRLTTALMLAFEIGDDVDPLNPKRAQLQSLGPSLEHLSQELRREIAALSPATDTHQPLQATLRQTLERLSAQVTYLMQSSQAHAS